MVLVTSVEVETQCPFGFATFARCIAEKDAAERLIIRSIDDRTVLATYALDAWRKADVRDEHGTIVDVLRSRIPHHPHAEVA